MNRPYGVVNQYLTGSGFPAAVLARAGPALRPGGGRRIEDSLSLKPELDRFVEEETGRGIEVAIAGLEEPGRPMRWKRASFDEPATPRSGF
jgi:hypothetical protein